MSGYGDNFDRMIGCSYNVRTGNIASLYGFSDVPSEKICCAINGADELTVHGLRKTLRGNQSHVRGNNAALGRDADMKAFPVIARPGWKLQRLPLFCPLPPYFCVVFPRVLLLITRKRTHGLC